MFEKSKKFVIKYTPIKVEICDKFYFKESCDSNHNYTYTPIKLGNKKETIVTWKNESTNRIFTEVLEGTHYIEEFKEYYEEWEDMGEDVRMVKNIHL